MDRKKAIIMGDTVNIRLTAEDKIHLQRTRLMKPCLSSLSPKCENSTIEKCIFESSLKNTETQQGGHHGEASIGSTGTTVVSDDHYSETKWAEHKKLVCREWRTAFQLLQLAAEDENCPAAADRRCSVRGTFAQLAENIFRCFCTNRCADPGYYS